MHDIICSDMIQMIRSIFCIILAEVEVAEPPEKKSFFWRIEARAAARKTGDNSSIYEMWRSLPHTSNSSLPVQLHEAFIDFNTTLPSSAPVERLFSLGKRVLTPTRTLLSDKNFEVLIMLAANSK